MMGDCSQGVRDCTNAIRSKPDFAVAYFYRAIAYFKDNNYDRAVADLMKRRGSIRIWKLRHVRGMPMHTVLGELAKSR